MLLCHAVGQLRDSILRLDFLVEWPPNRGEDCLRAAEIGSTLKAPTPISASLMRCSSCASLPHIWMTWRGSSLTQVPGQGERCRHLLVLWFSFLCLCRQVEASVSSDCAFMNEIRLCLSLLHVIAAKQSELRSFRQVRSTRYMVVVNCDLTHGRLRNSNGQSRSHSSCANNRHQRRQ